MKQCLAWVHVRIGSRCDMILFQPESMIGGKGRVPVKGARVDDEGVHLLLLLRSALGLLQDGLLQIVDGMQEDLLLLMARKGRLESP